MRRRHLRDRRAGRLERRHRQVHADGGAGQRRQPLHQVWDIIAPHAGGTMGFIPTLI